MNPRQAVSNSIGVCTPSRNCEDHRLRIIYCVLLVALIGCKPADQKGTQVEVFFSPKAGCTEAIVGELDKAKKTILVQAYSFTSVPIAKALIAAHRRGVTILVLLDKSQRTEKYSSATMLLNEGLKPLIDAKHAIAHNKVMVPAPAPPPSSSKNGPTYIFPMTIPFPRTPRTTF